MFTMHGRREDPESSVRGGGGGGGGVGVGCPETDFILVFHRGQCEPGLPFEAIGPKGSYFFSGLSITVFLETDNNL